MKKQMVDKRWLSSVNQDPKETVVLKGDDALLLRKLSEVMVDSKASVCGIAIKMLRDYVMGRLQVEEEVERSKGKIQ